MLVLSRKAHEKVIIDDEIVIEILAIEGDRIRLGITCPREIPVHREEVWVAIQNGEPHPKSAPSETRGDNG